MWRYCLAIFAIFQECLSHIPDTLDTASKDGARYAIYHLVSYLADRLGISTSHSYQNRTWSEITEKLRFSFLHKLLVATTPWCPMITHVRHLQAFLRVWFTDSPTQSSVVVVVTSSFQQPHSKPIKTRVETLQVLAGDKKGRICPQPSRS